MQTALRSRSIKQNNWCLALLLQTDRQTDGTMSRCVAFLWTTSMRFTLAAGPGQSHSAHDLVHALLRRVRNFCSLASKLEYNNNYEEEEEHEEEYWLVVCVWGWVTKEGICDWSLVMLWAVWGQPTTLTFASLICPPFPLGYELRASRVEFHHQTSANPISSSAMSLILSACRLLLQTTATAGWLSMM